MKTVTEIVDAFPQSEETLEIERNEKLLFTKPGPPASKMLQTYPPLEVLHFNTNYEPMKFAPPRDIYSSDFVRIEWQNMGDGARQPFIHRNLDVNEINYHLTGMRVLMTERGSVDLQKGDFARIPVFVAHDNYGVEDVHLIFYIHGAVEEQTSPSRVAEHQMPPFDGWEAQAIPEVMTECLGTPGCDRSYSLVDEELFINRALKEDAGTLNVTNAYEKCGASPNHTQWFYKSDHTWLGSTTLQKGVELPYRRHRAADEIQCQVKGTRIVITQRGTVELEAGDFVMIPLGTAFTSVVRDEDSTHLSVLTTTTPETKGKVVRTADETTWEMVKEMKGL